jgi:hypothetical protein
MNKLTMLQVGWERIESRGEKEWEAAPSLNDREAGSETFQNLGW